MTNSQSKLVKETVKPKRASPDRTKPSIKRNKECECERKVHPSFGIASEKLARCCSQCKTDEMVNLVCKSSSSNRTPIQHINKRNKECECERKVIPSFGIASEKLVRCCSQCKTDEMINLVSKHCPCGVYPVYNLPGEKKGICCKNCKTPEMVNVKDAKCRCGSAIPIFGIAGTTKPICCIKCKEDGMVDVINKNKMCLCGKARATLNEVGETKPKYCKACKPNNDVVNVIDKKCRCGKVQPNFGLESDMKAVCCQDCKDDNMIDVRNRNKMCVVCKKIRASYNLEGSTKAEYCVSCKSDIMIDVVDTHCIGINGKCPIGQLANPKFDGYCSKCFTHKFPNDPRIDLIRRKTKEIAVRDFINSNYQGFQHDELLWTGHCDCSVRRRIDHRILIGNTLLAIETDENQHKSYNEMDEDTRYNDLYMAFSGKWVYIRFNPDRYKTINGAIRNPSITNRLNILKAEIDKQIKRIENEENTELVERIYLFYDGYQC